MNIRPKETALGTTLGFLTYLYDPSLMGHDPSFFFCNSFEFWMFKTSFSIFWSTSKKKKKKKKKPHSTVEYMDLYTESCVWIIFSFININLYIGFNI